MADGSDGEAKIIDAIYRGACDSAELARALELIAEYFDSPGVVLGELDQAQPQSQFAVGVRTLNQEYFVDYGKYADFDPAPRAVAAMAVGTAEITSRIFSEHVRRTNVFLNEFFLPRGVDGTLASPLVSSGGRFALIGVFQSIHRRRYDDDDVARLERLTPHLIRALQIRRLFLQSEARGKVLELIVHRNETAMVALRGDGPALFVNDAARALAAVGDGLALDRRGRLVVADRAAAMRLTTLHADVLRGGAGGIMRIPTTVASAALCRPGFATPGRRGYVCKFRLAAFCLPFTTRPGGRRRQSSASRSCCTFRSEPPRWCRHCLRASSSRTMRTAPAFR